jgi:flavin reductase (DIM6/NTAB) family NADH-FMN oxidoreductase RutF
MAKRSLGARTLLFPTPMLIVGTYDAEGRPNGMAAAWGGVCCSRPPCIAVSLRAATYSHGSILAGGCFTVSIPSEQYVREADYMGIYSGRDGDKFAALGLTSVRGQHVNAPYVAEFPIALECRLAHVHELGLHTQFVGEVLDVIADESVLDAEGNPDIELIKPLLSDPGKRRYFGVGAFLGDAWSIGRRDG